MNEDEIRRAEKTCLNVLQAARESDETDHAHVVADEAITEFLRVLGYGHLVDAYEEIDKWYY